MAYGIWGIYLPQLLRICILATSCTNLLTDLKNDTRIVYKILSAYPADRPISLLMKRKKKIEELELAKIESGGVLGEVVFTIEFWQSFRVRCVCIRRKPPERKGGYMGAGNVMTNEYFDTKERVADLLNRFIYRGRELTKPKQVKEIKNVLARVEHGKLPQESTGRRNGAKRKKRMPGKSGPKKHVQTVTVDVVREVESGMTAVIVMLEKQTDIHYAMPIRALNIEAVVYHTQWCKAASVHSQKKDLSGAEYLSDFGKGEKIKLVLLIVLYWGQEPWDGPRSLKDMIDLEAYMEELRELTIDYPLHLIEARRYERAEEFKMDLKYVLGFLQHDNDIDGLKCYLKKMNKRCAAWRRTHMMRSAR